MSCLTHLRGVGGTPTETHSGTEMAVGMVMAKLGFLT